MIVTDASSGNTDFYNGIDEETVNVGCLHLADAYLLNKVCIS